MRAIELRIQEAHEKADEWIEFLAKYSDERLDKRIDIIRKQQLIAEQNKDALGFDYMLILEEITILARIYKEENNIPDAATEEKETYKQYQSTEVIQEKRQELYTKIPSVKISKPKIQEDNSSQMSLF